MFKQITKIMFILIVGVTPFILGLYYCLKESDGYLNIVIGGLLSMSVSLVLIGTLIGSLKNDEANIMSLCGFLTAMISGFLYFGISIMNIIG